jgi:hypothetical protein
MHDAVIAEKSSFHRVSEATTPQSPSCASLEGPGPSIVSVVKTWPPSVFMTCSGARRALRKSYREAQRISLDDRAPLLRLPPRIRGARLLSPSCTAVTDSIENPS